jgi:predicted RNase H-like nuclease (RuvC/YqgF family)
MTFINEIRELLATPTPADAQPLLKRLDETLTTGYANALQLEAERWRLERRLGEVAAAVDQDGNRDVRAEELATLARSLRDANEEVAALRELLVSLRDRRRLLYGAA